MAVNDKRNQRIALWISCGAKLDVLLRELADPDCGGYRCFPDVVDDEITDVIIDVAPDSEIGVVRADLEQRLQSLDGVDVVGEWFFYGAGA